MKVGERRRRHIQPFFRFYYSFIVVSLSVLIIFPLSYSLENELENDSFEFNLREGEGVIEKVRDTSIFVINNEENKENVSEKAEKYVDLLLLLFLHLLSFFIFYPCLLVFGRFLCIIYCSYSLYSLLSCFFLLLFAFHPLLMFLFLINFPRDPIIIITILLSFLLSLALCFLLSLAFAGS